MDTNKIDTTNSAGCSPCTPEAHQRAGENSGDWDREILQVQHPGTTGSGKGIELSTLADQCLAKGEAIFNFDSKGDENISCPPLEIGVLFDSLKF